MTLQPARDAFQRLSVVIPMWNEQEYLGRAVAAVTEAGQALIALREIVDYELVLVDDASTDATPLMADAAAREDSHIKVVHHQDNRGLGGSIRSGLAHASGDVVLYTDADLPFDLLEAVKACRVMRLYEADIVSAYRLDRTGEGPRRALYSWGYNSLVQAVFGTRVRDVNFAFKLVRSSVLEAVSLRSEGSFIDAELLVRAQRMGFRVIQFGVDYFPRTRGVSTLSSPAVIGQILREMVTLRRDLQSLNPPAHR